MNRMKFLLAGIVTGSMALSSEGYAETLESVIAKALSEHPQAQAGLSRVQAQQETIGAARADYWPSLDVVAGIGQQRKNFPEKNDIDGVTLTRKEASFSIRQNIFSGFNTMSAVKGAKKRSLAERWRFKSTLEELALKIADVYLKVLEQQDQINLAVENKNIHDEIYQQIKKRTAQGVARQSDLAQIEGRRARANANLINARNNLVDAESKYMSLVGTMPVALEQPGSYGLSLPETLDEAIQLSMTNNPGIKAANFDIQSSQAQYKSVRSANFPTMDFEVDQNWRHNADGTVGLTRDRVAMLRVRYNLFRGGGDRARVQERAYKVEESRAQRDRAFRNTEESLRIAWAALELTGQQREFLALHEKSSKETVLAYEEQFNIGKRTLLDVLDGENELFQSSQSLTSAVYKEAYARYRILGAMGQLLLNLEITLPDSYPSE